MRGSRSIRWLGFAGAVALAAALRAAAGPYPPAAGLTNSTALHLSTNLFVAWASGWTNYLPGIDEGDMGFDSAWTNAQEALGPPDAIDPNDPWQVVSLGGGGQITLTFDTPIEDAPGWDFAIFENAVAGSFLELAFVEVSSDGRTFVRFDSVSLTTNTIPFWGGAVEPTNLDGLAGKYKAGYGMPFDLAVLPDIPGLDKRAVRFVRLIDITGNGSVMDSLGHPIYDPYPTTGSPGFDLDAVGIIHASMQQALSAAPGGELQASWLLLSNFVYEVQWSDRLDGETWQSLGGAITGRNEEVVITDTPAAAGRFYRVMRRPL